MDGSELVADIRCRTGESPLWHPEEACLYWMDIPNGHLLRYDPARRSVTRVWSGPVLGGATLQRDGGIALFGIHGTVIVWNQDGTRTIIEELACVRGTRFNDAVADSGGRVLGGTMPTATRQSCLVGIHPDGSHRVVLQGLGQSNGMALSADERVLYHVDTREAVLRAYDYDIQTAELRSPRVVRRFDPHEGRPDGMAADEEGGLWVAIWGGGCVARIDPTSGEELGRLRVPTPRTSSVAFGGDDLSDLYITTAGGDDRARHGELAGSLFVARAGLRGSTPHRSDF